MQLLLCAATEFEIKDTVEFIGKENLPGVDSLITGVGMMSTAYALTKKIFHKRPDLILQAGVGGCLDETVPLATIVLIENEHIGDLGVEENTAFHTLFDLNLLNENSFPWKEGKLSNSNMLLKTSQLPVVDAVTVNEISTSRERIAYYKNQLKASVESMEGAALHFVALQEKIPFLQMRSLSNFAGERDKSKWVMNTSIDNLNRELKKMITKLLSK